MSARDGSADEEAAWFRFEPPLVPEGGDLAAFTARAFDGAVAAGLEYLDGGVVNSNYRVDVRRRGDPGAPVTVRLRLSRSDDGPLREGAVLSLARTRLRAAVPALLASERGERPEAHRRSFFTWIPGEPLDAVPGLPDTALARVAEELGADLARLHARHFEAFGRLDRDVHVVPPGGAAPVRRAAEDVSRRTAVRLGNPAHGMDSGTTERVRAGFERLLSRIGTAEIPAALVHGDLSPGNILVVAEPSGERRVADRSARLSGLIDWEMARAADPATDLASLRFEFGAWHPEFARQVEAAYLAEAATAARAAPPDLWETRVRLASVPILLDARMVGVRRRATTVVTRVDGRLREYLDGRSLA